MNLEVSKTPSVCLISIKITHYAIIIILSIVPDNGSKVVIINGKIRLPSVASDGPE